MTLTLSREGVRGVRQPSTSAKFLEYKCAECTCNQVVVKKTTMNMDYGATHSGSVACGMRMIVVALYHCFAVVVVHDDR